METEREGRERERGREQKGGWVGGREFKKERERDNEARKLEYRE